MNYPRHDNNSLHQCITVIFAEVSAYFDSCQVNLRHLDVNTSLHVVSYFSGIDVLHSSVFQFVNHFITSLVVAVAMFTAL